MDLPAGFRQAYEMVNHFCLLIFAGVALGCFTDVWLHSGFGELCSNGEVFGY